MSEDEQGKSRLSSTTRMECRVCWHVYDPAAGDPLQQIPPDTPFLELPGYWRCPECDAEPGAYLPIEE